jgi:glycosyltransferase involved in cell wall biosynthesis
MEVVLVDDGSREPKAVKLIKQLIPIFEKRGWKVIRQDNLYLGAARNTGARHASGE